MEPIGPEQLGSWFTLHAPALVLYARQWTTALAEDLVQEAFLRLLSQRRRPENVKAWLFRTVRNGALNALRGQRRREERQQRASDGQVQWFEARIDDQIDARAAQAVLASLPEAQRETVVLRIWGQMTFQEIADVVGEPISTVFSRYGSALAEIRQRMEKPCQKKKD